MSRYQFAGDGDERAKGLTVQCDDGVTPNNPICIIST